MAAPAVSSPLIVKVAVQEVPEPLMVAVSPSIVQASPVTDSLAVMVSVIVSPLLAYPEFPLVVIAIVERVGSVASCVKVNCVAAAMLSLPARSVIAPAATSMVTDSSLSVGVNVYVHTVSELEPAPLPTVPPARDSVGAASRASEAVTITV